MGDWKNEDDIKAELRVLTGKLRRLREELRTMVAPPKTHPSREFLHRQSFGPPREATSETPALAHDKPSKRRKRR